MALSCHADADGVGVDDGGATDAALGEPGFDAIYSEVIASAGCTLGLCHGEGATGGGLDLQPQQDAYEDLVGVASDSRLCGSLGLTRVVPGDPQRSLLWLKLGPSPPCGIQMPPGALLPVEQREQVERWIEAGAQR